MPWEVYERPQGYRDLVYAMASLEGDEAEERRLTQHAAKRR